jgi:hypothetical protein
MILHKASLDTFDDEWNFFLLKKVCAVLPVVHGVEHLHDSWSVADDVLVSIVYQDLEK